MALPGNPYAGVATARYCSPEALAMLTLAYEQRTANLIAFSGGGPSTTGTEPCTGEADPGLHEQIVRRLGLRGQE